MKNWATDFIEGGFTSFTYTDEWIRVFGNSALVRSKTVYTRIVDGKEITGHSIYTDTYIKERGEWKCIQAQIYAYNELILNVRPLICTRRICLQNYSL